jgi:hypothetical protein
MTSDHRVCRHFPCEGIAIELADITIDPVRPNFGWLKTAKIRGVRTRFGKRVVVSERNSGGLTIG